MTRVGEEFCVGAAGAIESMMRAIAATGPAPSGEDAGSEGERMMMTSTVEPAGKAIARYAHAMDRKRFSEAAEQFTDEALIDYSAVGGPHRTMERSELSSFLDALLGSSELRVHTALMQVIVSLDDPAIAIAYYTASHFRGSGAGEASFRVYGWYEIRMKDKLIAELKVVVQAAEGDPGILQ